MSRVQSLDDATAHNSTCVPQRAWLAWQALVEVGRGQEYIVVENGLPAPPPVSNLLDRLPDEIVTMQEEVVARGRDDPLSQGQSPC